ncbi:MAG: hypothetical protein ACOVN7_01390 [Rubrivivax sp.]
MSMSMFMPMSMSMSMSMRAACVREATVRAELVEALAFTSAGLF